MTTMFVYFCVLLLWRLAASLDVFCGSLTIFEQQRFGTNSLALSSQETNDLKQCLELCCSVMNCRGVTFTGVIVPHEGQPNCLLVGCRGDSCDMNQRAEYADGLISVLINRTMVESAVFTNFSVLENSTPNSPSGTNLGYTTTAATNTATNTIATAATNIATNTIATTTTSTTTHPDTTTTTVAVETSSNTIKTHDRSITHTLAPVWAVGLAIVIAVVCVGLNLGLLSAYICYRRQRSRKQTAQISANKGPTLHAYNPTL